MEHINEKSLLLHFDNLVGIEGKYEGADELSLQFKFDNIIWKAIEDEMDSYRSMLDFVVYADENESRDFISQDNLANVILESANNEDDTIQDCFAGYVLKDVEDGHVWLKIGTSYMDQWYPCIVFNHTPKLTV